MKPDFMARTVKIMAEIRARTCIDKIDTEVIEYILKGELIKYHNEVFTYGHGIGYDDGYIAGDAEGYEAGYKRGVNDTIGERKSK